MQTFSVELSETNNISLLMDDSYAHGFLSLENNSILHYVTTCRHSPAHDRGILWSSIDFDWPIDSPILSSRDMNHPPIFS